MRQPFVDIVVLNLNAEADTAECLLSLEGLSYTNYRVILVDNGSTDGSGYSLKKKFPKVEFLRSDINTGFAGGCNTGMKYSMSSKRADYILLLNNDTRADKNLLNSLLEVGESRKDIGVLGAVNYYYSRPDEVHMAAHRYLWWFGIQGRIRRVKNKFLYAQSVSGCCMLIKKEVVEKIGFLDERFFAYYEDSDFCLRAQRTGFKTAAVRDAKVWHKINKVIGTKTAGEYYIYTRNQPLFMLKNCPRIFLLDYFAVYFLKVFLRVAFFFVTCRRDNAAAVLRGFWDFLSGNFGEGRVFG